MLTNITNEKIENFDPSENRNKNIIDIFVFAIGYEERSLAMYDHFFNDEKIEKIAFLFNDYKKYPIAVKNYKKILNNSVETNIVDYSDSDIVFNIIKTKISSLKPREKKINVHFDYSSMPRSWYCQLAIKSQEIIKKGKVYFWYAQGDYQQEVDSWPSAGIEDFCVFAGRASLRPINERSHILGVGFDSLRAHAIASVLDPSYLVITLSHAQGDMGMRKKVKEVNQEIINASAYSVTLPIDDFVFSMSKLYETIKELLPNGDVILVPDGPKPQVLVSSIMPQIFNGVGVVCLHVKRHDSIYEAINVKFSGAVFGFSYAW
jgi:hypothetical protein